MTTITPEQELKGIEIMLDKLGPKATYQQVDEKERTVTITFGYGVINHADMITMTRFCADLNFDMTISTPKEGIIRVEMSSNQLD